MSRHGGIIIYKFSNIKSNWTKIQDSLFDLFSSEFEKDAYVKLDLLYINPNPVYNDNFDLVKAQEISEYDISDKTCKEFVEWLRTLTTQRDTPFCYEESIIFPQGDNTPGSFEDFVWCFNKHSNKLQIETW